MNKELLKIIAENPNLPIHAWVDSDICGDDGCCRWLGSFGNCSIDKFVSIEMNGINRFILFDDREEMFDYFCSIEGNEKLSEEEIREKVDNLNWQKAIFVYVNLPTL